MDVSFYGQEMNEPKYQPGQLTCITIGSKRPTKVSSELMSPVHYDTIVLTYTVYTVKYKSRYTITVG